MKNVSDIKIGILSTHPIQYYAPIFELLAKKADLSVYYCHKPDNFQQGTGFGVPFKWDVDLLSGYRYHWLQNISKKPGLDHFSGLDTPQIQEIIAKDRFDSFLVFGWNFKSYWQAMRTCWRLKVPLLVRGDSRLSRSGNPFRNMYRECTHRFFIPKFSACLATGKLSEEYFRHFGAKRIYMSPHCVNNEFFDTETMRAKTLKTDLQKRWNIPEDCFVFLFVGKFEEKKRPMDILLAVKRIGQVSTRKRYHVLMIGDGELRAICEDFSRKHSLPVSFGGFLNQSEMPSAYAVSDVLVLPSDYRETWGLVVNEAMSSGMSVIVSDEVGCAQDLVVENETGFIYPCRDSQALAEKMRQFVQRESLSLSMGPTVRRRIDLYSRENAVQGIVKAIEEVKNAI